MIWAGVILALAIFLLFYLIHPRRRQVVPPKAPGFLREWCDELPPTTHGMAVQSQREAEQTLQKKQNLPGPM